MNGEDGKSEERLNRQYDQYLKDIDSSYNQARYAFENLDKWLLTISSAGFAVATARAWINNSNETRFLGLAAFSFVIAIAMALMAKGAVYILSRKQIEYVRVSWIESPYSYHDSVLQKLKPLIDKWEKRVMVVNISCFICFLFGIIFIAINVSIAQAETPPTSGSEHDEETLLEQAKP